ncbi:MAG: RDD family protein [Psychrosphaera sp.]|nr:RDD family protein [Psychrosphaera sp.]
MSNPYESPESDISIPGSGKPYVYVGFWTRVGASLIDTVLVLILMIPIFMFLAIGSKNNTSFDTDPIMYVINYVIFPIVVMVFWRYRSATPGKMILSLVIIDAKSGGRLSTGQVLLRYLGYYIGAIPLGLGFFMVGWDKKKQGLHDKIAGTLVVRYTNELGATGQKEPSNEI